MRDVYMCDVYMCDVYMCNVYMCNVYMCNVYMCNIYECNLYMCDVYMCDVFMCNVYMCDVYMCDVCMCDVCMCDVYVWRFSMQQCSPPPERHTASLPSSLTHVCVYMHTRVRVCAHALWRYHLPVCVYTCMCVCVCVCVQSAQCFKEKNNRKRMMTYPWIFTSHWTDITVLTWNLTRIFSWNWMHYGFEGILAWKAF